MFSFQGNCGCIQDKVLVNRPALNVVVPVSCRVFVFPRYTPISGSAVCSVGLFLRLFWETQYTSPEYRWQFTSQNQRKKATFSPRPTVNFWFLLFGRMTLRTDGKWYLFVVLICTTRLLGCPRRAYAFFLNIFRKKAYALFGQGYCWRSSAPFQVLSRRDQSPFEIPFWQFCLVSSPFLWLTSRHFSTLRIFYNPTWLWIAVPLSSIFQLVSFGTGHKTAGLLQALYRFRGQAEPLINSSSSLEIRVACACPNT